MHRPDSLLYISDTGTDPYWNLAAEEYLLKQFDRPVFRLWQNDNAIIVGQYQNTLAEIDIDYVKEHRIKVVRRLTGGGAVFHDLGNLNFTFIERRRENEESGAMFRRFTAPILDALASLGVQASLEGRNDLLIDGRKFSGNAICIHKNRILQHGTLLFSSSMSDLSGALRSRPEKFTGKAVQSNRSRVTNISEHLREPMTLPAFRQYLGEYICSRHPEIIPYEYSSEDREAIGKLKSGKYALDDWNFGRSPAYGFGKTAKFPGGLVEVYFTVREGRITGLQLYGDYFFTRPTETFAASLIGTPHTREALFRKFEELDRSVKAEGDPLGLQSYFLRIAPEELLSLFFD